MKLKLKTEKLKFYIGDMTITDLSKKSNVSRVWINKVIKEGYATMNIVLKLANALNIDPKEIVYIED